MKLKIDTDRTYAVTLEGGGAKGAYQVGAWRALDEAGIKYNAVSGSSVGALNGAMMAMRDLDKARELWGDINFSKVMDVNDSVMKRLFIGDYFGITPGDIAKKAVSLVKEGGFDVTPLRNLLKSVVDEGVIRRSDVELFIVTYSKTDKRELDLDAKKLDDGEIIDMLLASAYFPAFKHETLRGKSYTDGGVKDVFPINSLLSRGYRDIIAIRIYGVGIEKRVKIPKDARITTIAPLQSLGSVLNFGQEQCRRNMALGYYDAQRVLYGLYGRKYYIDRTMSERDAYNILSKLVEQYYGMQSTSIRTINEELLPRLARKCGCGRGDYYDVFVDFIEDAADGLGIYEFGVYTDKKLYQIIASEAAKPRRGMNTGALKYLIK